MPALPPVFVVRGIATPKPFGASVALLALAFLGCERPGKSEEGMAQGKSSFQIDTRQVVSAQIKLSTAREWRPMQTSHIQLLADVLSGSSKVARQGRDGPAPEPQSPELLIRLSTIDDRHFEIEISSVGRFLQVWTLEPESMKLEKYCDAYEWPAHSQVDGAVQELALAAQ
jgi:hypothetical protein